VTRVSKRKGYYTVEGVLGGGHDAAETPFTCTVRNGRIYTMRIGFDEA
jgi:hypothetical protein